MQRDTVMFERTAGLCLVFDTPKGRGVFATQEIPSGAIIDVCPVLVLGFEENIEHIEKTSLYHYTYNWPVTDVRGKRLCGQAVVLGLGSMFNHSGEDQNVVWERNVQSQIVVYRAARQILAGEELCISYGSRLWFKDADAPQRTEEEDGSTLLSGISFEF